MAVPLVNPDGLLQVNDAGECLIGDEGDACCCGDGGGGEPYWIYLRIYCTPDDCQGAIKVWSETAWGDGTTWGESFFSPFPDDYGVFRLNGVCYQGPSSVNCEEGNVPVYNGPGNSGQWYRWNDRDAPCGPCCPEDFRCIERRWEVCDAQNGGLPRYACAPLGRGYTVVSSTNGQRRVELTPEYLAALQAADPQGCYSAVLQTQYCNESKTEDARYVVNSQGCINLVGRCIRHHRDGSQTAWFGDPFCENRTTGYNEELCDGAESGVPDPHASTFGTILEACGFARDVRGPYPFRDPVTSCRIRSGTVVSDLGGGSFSTYTWDTYEDGGVSRWTDTYEARYMCSAPGGGSMLCIIETSSVEYLIQFLPNVSCQDGDIEECDGVPRAGAGVDPRSTKAFAGRGSREVVTLVDAGSVEIGEDLL